ncbi:MAG: MarR family transcriptional regulator [Azoarcus sp.]|jgi:DNA-binding MarR family transcriptional regulator|nr:MarR family transcriptional regulator [Azoarcus sp.]
MDVPDGVPEARILLPPDMLPLPSRGKVSGGLVALRNAPCATNAVYSRSLAVNMARHSFDSCALMPETRKPEPCSDEQLLYLFHRAAKWMVRGHFHRDAVRHAQGHILSVLGESENVSQRELLERLHIRSASLSELLIKLEKSGAIVRRRSEKDKRNFLLQLTEQGRIELAEQHWRRRQNAERLFSVLSAAERESLSGLLIRLLDAWEAEERQREGSEDGWGQIKRWLKREIRQKIKR